MLASIKKMSLSLVVLAGFGCDGPVPDEGADVVIDRIVLQEEIDELQALLPDSQVCVEDGVAIDELLDGESSVPEHRLAAELMEDYLAVSDADMACSVGSMGSLAATPDIAAACEFVNTGACTKCIAGFEGCSYCFQGSWYCPIFGCEVVVGQCGDAEIQEKQ